MQKVTNIIQKSDPHTMGKLDNSTWVHYIPLPFLEDDNSTVTLQKGGRGTGWFNAKYKSCMNDSIALINIYKGYLYTEGNTCGVIIIPGIELTFEK